MKKINGGMVALSALAVLGATDVSAQIVESIMRARERLELTEVQIESLDNIRRETVEERTTEMAEMQELRSQLDAGQIRRSDLMAFMEERQEARAAVNDQRRARVETVLTESQLEMVQEMRRRGGRSGVGVRPGGRPGRDGPGSVARRSAGVGPHRPFRGPPRASLRNPQRRGDGGPPIARQRRRG